MDKQAVLEKSKDSSTNDNEQDQVASEKSTLKHVSESIGLQQLMVAISRHVNHRIVYCIR
jgi:hypothetical protein